MQIPGLIVIVITAVLAFAPANAQQDGSITGVVRDQRGAVLPGATVDVADSAIGLQRRVFVTDREGRYTVSNLSPGSYTLTFRLPGFAGTTVSDVVVTGIAPTQLDVALRVGPLGETVRPRPPLPFRLPEAPQDTRAECLHGPNETEAERARRLEAFNAMQMIYSVLEQVPTSLMGYPDWQTLARSNPVAALKKRTGITGELANKIQWGTSEPLPGWRIRYLYGISVEYALTDITDDCRFTLSSNDPAVIAPRARTRPLTPHVY